MKKIKDNPTKETEKKKKKITVNPSITEKYDAPKHAKIIME